MSKTHTSFRSFFKQTMFSFVAVLTLGLVGASHLSSAIHRAENPPVVLLTDKEEDALITVLSEFTGETAEATKRRKSELVERVPEAFTVDLSTPSGFHRVKVEKEGDEFVVKDAWRL